MRHSFASWLVQAGVSLYEVKERLGHKSISMTERYSHLAPEAGRGTVAVLGWDTPEAERAFQRVAGKYADWSKTEPYIFSGSSAGSDKFGILRVTYT